MLKRPSKNISLYLNYPTEERLNILRERVKSWNALDKLKEQRLSKIANQKEIVAYLMNDAETVAIVNSRQKEIDRRKNKQEQIAETKPVETEHTLPAFVQDVLDGGSYPEKYECTIEEQKILYNQKFLELFQQYRTAKSQTTADIVLSQIVSLVKELDQ
jgi:hypothetical protein